MRFTLSACSGSLSSMAFNILFLSPLLQSWKVEKVKLKHKAVLNRTLELSYTGLAVESGAVLWLDPL
jgi:hypothetical protein